MSLLGLPQTTTDWGAQTTEMYSLAVPEAASLRSAGMIFSEGSVIGLQTAVFSMSSHGPFYVSVSEFPLHIRTGVRLD